MKIFTLTFGLLTGLIVPLTGCGTMNSHFTCNNTAKDSCLTIEEVDAMTHFVDGKTNINNSGRVFTTRKGQSLWIPTKATG